jgi:uncharacterized membrane protein
MTDKSAPLDESSRRRAKRIICRLLASGCVVAMALASRALAQLLADGKLNGEWALTPKLLVTTIVVCSFAMVGLLAAYPRTPEE